MNDTEEANLIHHAMSMRKYCGKLVQVTDDKKHWETQTLRGVIMDETCIRYETEGIVGNRHRAEIYRWNYCRFIPSDDKELTAKDVEWVVNNFGELGVRIHGKCFFLYKGGSLEYGVDTMLKVGIPMMVRRVEKKEFGETCLPLNRVLKTDGTYNYGEGWEKL